MAFFYQVKLTLLPIQNLLVSGIVNSDLGDTIGARWGAFVSVITRTRSRWCKFRDLVPLLASRGLPFNRQIIFGMCT